MSDSFSGNVKDTQDSQLAKRGSGGRKKLKKRQLASDDEEPSETIGQDKLLDDQADFEEDKDDLGDNEDLINNKMTIEELEARMKEIEAKIEGKTKFSKSNEVRKRDLKKKEKGAAKNYVK